MSISFLINDYNDDKNNTNYSFLRVLSKKEKTSFIHYIQQQPDLLKQCCQTRTIKTYDWIDVLEHLPLETEYHLYRKAYWGENAGKQAVSPVKTDTMALVCIITGVYQQQDHHPIRLSLLLENNQVSILRNVVPASWSNDRYVLDSTENLLL